MSQSENINHELDDHKDNQTPTSLPNKSKDKSSSKNLYKLFFFFFNILQKKIAIKKKDFFFFSYSPKKNCIQKNRFFFSRQLDIIFFLDEIIFFSLFLN